MLNNEYGLFIGKGVPDDELIEVLDSLLGEDAYSTYRNRYAVGYKWGIGLKGWSKEEVLEAIANLTSLLPTISIAPTWEVIPY